MTSILPQHRFAGAGATALAALLCASAAAGPPIGAAAILHVDDDAPEGGDGRDWESAFRHLQDALTAARAIDAGPIEIRIAQGIYHPDQGAGQRPGDIEATFDIPADLPGGGGIALRGGYAGWGALPAYDPDDRDLAAFSTVLSGDLRRNDGPPNSFQNYEDNSYQLARMTNADEGTVMEGLILTASQTDYDPTLGGGLACVGGTARIERCTFTLNASYTGAGALFRDCTATISDTLFDRNWAQGGGGGGGGLALMNSLVSIDRCAFIDNASYPEDGGAIYGGDVTLTDCQFRSNSADDGGALYALHSLSAMRCQFTGNVADYCGVFAGTGTFIDCSFVGNGAGVRGGDICGAGTFIRCVFDRNSAGTYGGAAVFGRGTFINCAFRRNIALTYEGGGALYLTGDSTFINTVFTANTVLGEGGGAAHVGAGWHASFTNCTFIKNRAEPPGTAGAVSGAAALTNCILWGTGPLQLSGPATAMYSNIGGGYPGAGNIAAEPRFVDLLGPDGIVGTKDDDLRLLPGSPCIDAGDSTALPPDLHDLDGDGDLAEPIPFDWHFGPRFVDDPAMRDTGVPDRFRGPVDIGALEFQPGHSSRARRADHR